MSIVSSPANVFARWGSKIRFRNGGLTIQLARLRREDVGLAGSKAVTLARLLEAGLPVPAGFVISVTAFKAFAESVPGWKALMTVVGKLDEPDAAEVGALSRKFEEAFGQWEVPIVVEKAVQRALEEFPEVRLWAVRSSGTAEDLVEASFAGQHESFLNVACDEVLKYVRRCWISLFSPRALAYRIRNNISDERATMAVIVQQMVPAEMAGVLFTADPVSGDRSRIVIEGARGLGDQVVSGHVMPDRVVLSKFSFEVLERTAGRVGDTALQESRQKERVKIGLTPHPGPLPFRGEGEDTIVLEDVAARGLAEVSLRAERILGRPLDVEWAVCGGEMFLLQARPITGLNGARSWEDRQVWINVNSGEVLPDVTTPITMSMLESLAEWLGRSFFGGRARLGLRPIEGLVAGRVYCNVNALLAAIKPFSFVFEELLHGAQAVGGGQIDTFRRLFQSIPDEDLPDLGIRWRRLLFFSPRIVARLISHSPRRGDAQTIRLKAQVDQVVGVDIEGMSTAELARFVTRLFREGFEGWDLLYLCRQAAVLPVFEIACRKWLDDPRLTLGYRLFAGLGGVAVAEAGLALWRLAAMAHSDPETELVLASDRTWEGVLAKLQQTEHGRQFVGAWNAFMLEHGHHCRGELELFNARWCETPDYILRLVRGYLGSIDQGSPLENQRRLAEKREQLTEQCRQRLKNPVKRWIFSRSLRRAQKLALNREEWKNQAVRQIAFLRRALLTLGQRLHEQGILLQREDIFFLEVREIEGVALGNFGARERIAVRRTEYETNLTLNPPPIVAGKYSPSTSRMPIPDGEVKVLRGIAVSPGRVTGRAKVILRSDDHEQVLPGEILIAPFTDPAWTPYFVSAAGVVMDQGGILSHGSIVAREYGLPAVTNLGSATGVIRTGDLVEVDGDGGCVTIIETCQRHSAFC